MAFVHAARGVLQAHAMLVSSEPAAEGVVATSPSRVRLVFSEEIEPSLAHIDLVAKDGHVDRLHVTGDPHDVDAVIGAVRPLSAGGYRVVWHVVSADGHPVGGSFVFWVGTKTGSPPPEAANDTTLLNSAWGPTAAGAPLLPAILRGLAAGFLMAFAGMLLFAVLAGSELSAIGGDRLVRWLSIAALLFLTLHAIAWSVNASPDHRLTADAIASAVGSTVGRIELWRLGLVALALWAVWLVRRPWLALVFAAGALVLSGATGHSAAISPHVAVPARALHLLAASAWLGGLLWLVTCRQMAIDGFAREARRVSAVALWASIVVAASGLAMVIVFLASPRDLVDSAYGAVLMAKVIGFLALMAFGAYHRFRAIPSLARHSTTSARMAATVRRELATMVIVILLGGLLAYVPPARSSKLPADAPLSSE
ncbi:MAG TPA: copper resistance protein CopC [Gemmatimonadaceae bacterium]|nr:copper resistance protein CopC [Gemmatimonadaceae bacterium]